jgi:hypothetical protein
MRLKLRVIPEPEPDTRTVFVEEDATNTVFMRGTEADVTWLCGACAAPLLEGVRLNQFANIVLKCGACGSYNDTAEGPR